MRNERRRTKRRALVNQTVRRANKARKQCLCQCGVDVRYYKSQAEAEAAKTEAGKFCNFCKKEILRLFFVIDKEVR